MDSGGVIEINEVRSDWETTRGHLGLCISAVQA